MAYYYFIACYFPKWERVDLKNGGSINIEDAIEAFFKYFPDFPGALEEFSSKKAVEMLMKEKK